MKKMQTRISVFSPNFGMQIWSQIFGSLGSFRKYQLPDDYQKFPNGDTTFFQKVNFHAKTTFDALILCLEFRRMFEIKKLKRVLENAEAISSYSHEYVQMG